MHARVQRATGLMDAEAGVQVELVFPIEDGVEHFARLVREDRWNLRFSGERPAEHI